MTRIPVSPARRQQQQFDLVRWELGSLGGGDGLRAIGHDPPRFGPLSVGTQLLLGYEQHAG
jgi:hypothetical protein